MISLHLDSVHSITGMTLGSHSQTSFGLPLRVINSSAHNDPLRWLGFHLLL